MIPDPNFPRWMYHRTQPAIMVLSQQELDRLGSDWAMRPWTASDEPLPSPDVPEPEEPEPEEPEEPQQQKQTAPLRFAPRAGRRRRSFSF